MSSSRDGKVDVQLDARLLSTLRMPRQALVGSGENAVATVAVCRGRPALRVPMTADPAQIRRLRRGSRYETALRRVVPPAVVLLGFVWLVIGAVGLLRDSSGMVNIAFLGLVATAVLLGAFLTVGLVVYSPSHPVQFTSEKVRVPGVNEDAAREWQEINRPGAVELLESPGRL